MQFEDIQKRGFRVVFGQPLGNPEIDHFTIEIKSGTHQEKCKVYKSESERYCDFTNLSPNTEFSVEVSCCLEGISGCSIPLQGTVWTKGMTIFLSRSFVNKNWLNHFSFAAE